MTEPMDLAAREDNLRRALAHLEQYLYSETWAGVSDAGPVKELVEWALDGIALVRQQRAALIEALGLLESVIRQQVNLPDAAFTARHVLMAAVALTTDDEDGA